MFGNKPFHKKKELGSVTDDRRKVKKMPTTKVVDTVIGKYTELSGAIKSSGTVRVDGKFEGEINTTSDLIIGEEGFVGAKVRAFNIIIAGRLEGDLEAQGKLEIVPTGVLIGNAKTGVLIIEEGAVFKGQVEMLAKDNKVIVKQNIAPKESAEKKRN